MRSISSSIVKSPPLLCRGRLVGDFWLERELVVVLVEVLALCPTGGGGGGGTRGAAKTSNLSNAPLAVRTTEDLSKAPFADMPFAPTVGRLDALGGGALGTSVTLLKGSMGDDNEWPALCCFVGGSWTCLMVEVGATGTFRSSAKAAGAVVGVVGPEG